MSTLIAPAATHETNISEDTIDVFLQLIKDNSADEREHVKKAASWALRELGKRNFELNERAIILAHELKESSNKTQVWIGKDALKELEKLVQVEGRNRLISSDSQMGKELNSI
jgi:3-methyladenine DNA glycosylase AlkD